VDGDGFSWRDGGLEMTLFLLVYALNNFSSIKIDFSDNFFYVMLAWAIIDLIKR
jgi:hypothetical protein